LFPPAADGDHVVVDLADGKYKSSTMARSCWANRRL